MHMIFRNGRAIDLDQVVFRGRPIRQWGRDELEAELLRLGVPIALGSGRDAMALAYHDWRSALDKGDSGEVRRAIDPANIRGDAA